MLSFDSLKTFVNKYFQILEEKRACRTFSKIYFIFLENVDNIENLESFLFTLKMVLKMKLLALSHRKVLVLEISVNIPFT